MKLFVFGVPHTQTTLEFTTCAYTMKVWNFCRMMTERGHKVIHFGVEGSNPICAEHVSIVPEDMWRRLYGHPGIGQFNTRSDDEFAVLHDTYADNGNRELRARIGKDYTELLCLPWGGAQCRAVAGIPQFQVETGIGYHVTFAPNRVFESYAWMHFHWGRENKHDPNNSRGWYDTVIPNSFDARMFPFVNRDKRSDTFLFMGRLNMDKGLPIAVDVTKRIGAKLLLVGPGAPPTQWLQEKHVSYLPPVGVEERKKIMGKAYAAFVPSLYLEPFGGVAVELMMTGCPVITTDWGVFNETVLHGVTGFRCRSIDQFIWAAKNIKELDCRDCRDWAVKNYSTERIAPLYEEFFQTVLDQHHPEGFYRENPNRTQLDFLRKQYPKGATRSIKIPAKHIPPPEHDVWGEANKWEADWWGLERNERWEDEERKQVTYARLMGLPYDLDMGEKKILDIGCGPTSMLLHAVHGPSVGVDPLKVSDETHLKYTENGIEFKNIKAEDYIPDRTFDETWIYNCLQHTDSPDKILQTAALSSEAVRIFEWINMGVCPGHPQNLTEELFRSFFPVDKWNLVIWNTGILHGFGGTVTNNYIAIHAIRKSVLMRMEHQG